MTAGGARSRGQGSPPGAAGSTVPPDREVPTWIDAVERRATHPDPAKRDQELSEFVPERRHPNAAYLTRTRAPLLERNPVAFWRGLALILAATVVYLLLR